MKWLDVLLRRRPEPEREEKAVRIEELKAQAERILDRNDRLIEAYRHTDPQLRRR